MPPDDEDFPIVNQGGDDFPIVNDFPVVDVPRGTKFPKAPHEITKYLGTVGHIGRNLLSKKNKKKSQELVKQRLESGEGYESIIKDLQESGWNLDEQIEILDLKVPEKEETISVKDALSSLDKRDLLKLTPKQLESLSEAEKNYVSEKIEQFGEEEGQASVLSGLTFGFTDKFRQEEPEDFAHPITRSIGEMVGALPWYMAGNKKIVEPLTKLVKGSIKKGILSILGNAGLLATEQTARRLVKEGDVPKLEEYTGYLTDVAALEVIFRSAGKLNPFKRKLSAYAKAKGISEEDALKIVVEDTRKVPKDEVVQKAMTTIDIEPVKEEPKQITTPEASKQITQQPPKKNKNEVQIRSDKTNGKEESKSVERPSKQLDVSKKKAKGKSKKKPITVDIPKEDIGKTAEEIVGQHVRTGKEPFKLKFPDLHQTLDVLETKLYNRFAPLKPLGKGETSILNKPRELAELVKGYGSTARSVLEVADYDLATGYANGPGFKKIFSSKRLKELTGKRKLDRVAFDRYLFSKASLERQELGQKSAVPTEAAKALIRKNPQFKELAQDLYRYGRNRISNLKKAGIVSEAGEKAMFEMYKAHAPLYRVMPEELSLSQQIRKDLTGSTPASRAPQAPGASNLRVKNPLTKAKGSERLTVSPTESIVKNTIAFENAITKNRTVKAVGNQLKKFGYEVKEIGAPKMSKAELKDLMGDFEVSDDMVENLNNAINVINPNLGTAKGKLRWYENGKLFEVKGVPKDIIEAIEGLKPEQANIVVSLLNKWKNAFAQGVVLQPGTMARLAGMDLVVSTLQTKFPKLNPFFELPVRAFYEYPRMLFNILGKSELYQDYMRSGAAQTSLYGLDRAMLESMTDTYTNALKRGDPLLLQTLNAPRKIIRAILKGLRKTSDVLGDIPRLLEYERSYEAGVKKGLSNKEAMAQAAFDAFEVSVPYGRMGSSRSLNIFYKIFPFINTIVNSNVSFVKALNPKNPAFRNTVLTGLAFLTLPSVALYLKNRNDPRYQALPQKDKDQNAYVYLTKDPDEEPLKLRKFWQFGWLFQTLPEHLIEFIIQRDPKAFDGLLASFEEEFSPFTRVSFSQAMKKGGFDFEKFFEGGRYSLVPDRLKKIDKELQATANTSEVAKLLAKFFHVSPIYIDHLVSMTGGGLGRDVIRIADEVIYQLGIEVDRRPHKQAADSIFYGTFFGRGPSKRNEYVNKFYEYVDQMETYKNSANVLKKQGKDEEAQKYLEKYVDLTAHRKKMAKYYKEIEEIRLKHPDDLDGVSKRKELNEIYREMTDEAKALVEDIEQKIQDLKEPKK